MRWSVGAVTDGGGYLVLPEGYVLAADLEKYAHQLGLELRIADSSFESVARKSLDDGSWRIEFSGAPTVIRNGWHDKSFLRRLRPQAVRHEKLVQAVFGRRLNPGETSVVDATAGWGRDGLLLAAAGARVTMLERQPLLVYLLCQALQEERAEAVLDAARQRVVVRAGDAREILAGSMSPEPDVIYLDPMYGDDSRKAASKKQMAFLQRALAHQSPAEDRELKELLALACATARRRVVVKRTPLLEPVGGLQPAYSLSGKAVRYDIYLT